MSPDSSKGVSVAIAESTAAAGTMSQTARGAASLPTKSASDSAPVACSAESAATACGDLSNTTHSWPPRISRRTMSAPMRPSPIIPSCIAASSSLLGDSRAPPRRPHDGIVPQREAAGERIRVVAAATIRRQLRELADVAATDQYFVGLESSAQTLDHGKDMPRPFVLPAPLEPTIADVVLVGALPVRQVAELHRLDNPVDDEGRSETGAEPEEQHAPTAIATERLHGGIVDQLHRVTERRFEVEADPAPAEITGLGGNAPVQHRARIADRHGLVLPTARHSFRLGHHRRSGQSRAGRESARLGLAARQQLDMVSADVDGEHFHRSRLRLSSTQ